MFKKSKIIFSGKNRDCEAGDRPANSGRQSEKIRLSAAFESGERMAAYRGYSLGVTT